MSTSPAAAAISADLYERLLPFVRTHYDAHDKTCPSMRFFWLGHRGGVSGIGEQRDCDGCQATFYYDGLVWVNWATHTQDEEDTYLCGCCAITAGHQVRVSEFGLRLQD